MQHRLPALGCFQPHAGVVKPPLIVIIDQAIGIGRPDDLGHRVCQLAKVLFCEIKTGVVQSLIPHIPLIAQTRNDEKDVGKDDPSGMFDRSPVAYTQYPKDRLWPE